MAYIWPQPSLHVSRVLSSHVSFLCCGVEAAGGRGDRSSGPQRCRKLDPGLWCHGDGYYRNARAALSRTTRICVGFHRLKPAERGISVVLRDPPPHTLQSEGPVSSWGCPTCVSLFLSCHFSLILSPHAMQPLVSVAMAAAVSAWNSYSGFFTWLIPAYLPGLILMLSFVQQICMECLLSTGHYCGPWRLRQTRALLSRSRQSS